MVDCHATANANWRRTKPNVLRSANSRRRRRTDATSVRANAADRSRGQPAAEQRRRRALER